MSPPPGALVGALVLVVVLLLAARRPLLAWLGIRLAVQRPRQLTLAALGLLVATAVIAGAGVTGDSARDGLHDRLVADLGATDLAIEIEPALPRGNASAILAHAGLDPYLETAVWTVRTWATVVDERNLQSERNIAIWGVEPAESRRLGGWNPTDGDLPQDLAAWPAGGAVLNARLANRLHARVGDDVSLLVRPYHVTRTDLPLDPGTPGPSEPVREPHYAYVNLTAHLVLTVASPQGGYVHSPEDAYVLSLPVPVHSQSLELRTGVPALVAGPAPTDVDLEVEFPNGTTRLLDDGSPTAPNSPTLSLGADEVTPGNLTVRVHSKNAANVTVFVNTTLFVRPPQPVISYAPPARQGLDLNLTPLRGPVVAIVDDRASDPLAQGPALFLPRPTLEHALGAPAYTNVGLVALRDHAAAPAARTLLEQRLAEYHQTERAPTPFGTPHLRSQDLRTQAEDEAQDVGEGVKFFFLALGSFSVLAGVLLIVSLLTTLVEERKVDLATLRATGAQRSHLTRLHVFEGSVYAIAAAFAGIAAGILLAWFNLRGFASEIDDAGGLPLRVRPATLLSSAGAGLALTVIVLALAAHRLGAFNVARALRGEDAPARRLTWARSVGYALLVLVGGALSGLGWLGGGAIPSVVGPAVLALGLGGLLHRLWPGAGFPAWAGGLLAAYVATTFFTMDGLEEDSEFLLFPLRGLLLTLGLALLLVHWQAPTRWTGAALARLPPLAAIAPAATAYTLGRRTRAVLLVAMVGMVTLTLALTSTLSLFFARDYAGSSAGFDVIGTTEDVILGDPAAFLARNPPPTGLDPWQGVDRWLGVPLVPSAVSFLDVGGERLRSSRTSSYDGLGVTPEFAAAARYRVVALDPAYGDLAQALAAVATRSDAALLAEDFRRGEDQPVRVGDRLHWTRHGDNGTQLDLNLTVIGLYEGGLFGGLLMPARWAEPLSSTDVGRYSTRLWARVHAGVDPDAVAERLEGAFAGAHLDAVSIDQAERENREETNAQLSVIQVFVGIGLVAGVSSVGLLTIRNVLERRREIGMMRAVGARSSHILGLFVLEGTWLMTLGLVVGLSSGVLVSYGFWLEYVRDTGSRFALHWVNLGLVGALVYATAIVATLAPAWSATRPPPAEAVRSAE